MSLALVTSPFSLPDPFFCPKINTVNNASFSLSLDEYTRATWYVQKQQVNSYQPAEQLFCVTATYNLEGATVPLFGGTVVTVYNEATFDDKRTKVNGGGTLCARIADESQPDKLSVAPCFLPNLLAGPYWPVYIEADGEGQYSIVAVSGGQPDVPTDGSPFDPSTYKCTPRELGINNAGLWILSREPVADPAAVGRAEAALEAMGVATTKLLPVPQGAECEDAYASRFLKPRDCGPTADGQGRCNPTATAPPAPSCAFSNNPLGQAACDLATAIGTCQ